MGGGRTPDPGPRIALSKRHNVRAFTPNLLATILFVPLLTLAAPSRADLWYEHYARAEAAIADRHWQNAVRELNEALGRKGDSGVRQRTYGMRVVDYFPYLKLGIAYYNLGQLDAAEQAFETEERLEAVKSSADAHAELQRYRTLVRQAKEQATQGDQGRIAAIVEASTREADRLAGEGRLQQAMEALTRALAVDPNNAALATRMEQLRRTVTNRLHEQEETERAAGLVARGQELLVKGDLSEAASQFRQALAIHRTDEVERLLAQAQDRLRESVSVAAFANDRRTLIEESLRGAETLAANGQLDQALSRLEGVLALEPRSREALAIQSRLLRAIAVAAARVAVEHNLRTAEGALASDQVEAALVAANRVLALDAGNQRAVAVVRQAYQQISLQLLGPRRGGNIPPALRFADLREDRPDGSRAQVVRDARFRLSGVVIDSTLATVAVRDHADREVAVSTQSQSIGEYSLTEFVVSQELKAGMSGFRVTATDGEGLSSSSEYLVCYTPPLHRRPWFLVVIASVPLLAGAAVYTGIVVRRRRLLRRRFNPFIAGAPVLQEELFVGRNRLLDRILETIHNNSLLLYGERRIGKTSILHHLKRRLERLDDPDYAFFPVFVDLQGVSEERFFATLAEDVFAELRPRLGGLTPSAPTNDSTYSARELTADLRALLAALADTTTKWVKLVLLIDEVDELNAYDPRTNQKLRSLFMKSFADQLVAVVSGVEISHQWEKQGSPWYNFFEEIEIGSIPCEAVAELIQRPIRGVLTIDPGVVARITELSECKPYQVQKLCIALVNRAHATGLRRIGLGDVEAIAHEAG